MKSVMLSVIMLNVPMRIVFILSVAFSYCYPECRYAECPHAKRRGTL
jgi:hypothetical protein